MVFRKTITHFDWGNSHSRISRLGRQFEEGHAETEDEETSSLNGNMLISDFTENVLFWLH